MLDVEEHWLGQHFRVNVRAEAVARMKVYGVSLDLVGQTA